MARPLEEAMRTIFDIYDKYAVSSGDENIMRKGNLKELIQNEMNVGPILQKPEYQSLMADLEHNKNDEVDFKESMDILRRVSITEGTTSN